MSICKMVKGLPDSSKINLENGIHEDDADLCGRRNEFTSNICPEKGHSFWMFLWEPWKSTNFTILMIAAAAVLVPKALGKLYWIHIVTHNFDEYAANYSFLSNVFKVGLKVGGSFTVSAILLIVIIAFLPLAIRYYRISPLFQSSNEEKHTENLEVIRGGNRVKVAASDIIMGDVIPLKSGEKAPVDGVLIVRSTLDIYEPMTSW